MTIRLLLTTALLVPGIAWSATAVPSMPSLHAVMGASTTSASATPRRATGAPARPHADTSRVALGPAGKGTSAFVAWPAGEAPAPGVIVVHEWWGLNAQIRDVARRLAHEGYVAIVPDLYHGKVASDPERAHELSRGLEDDVALADLAAAARWLRSKPRTAATRFGIVGFCMGGRLSEAFALDTSHVAAAVMFYGSPITDTTRLARLEAPLQAHFGSQDEGISMVRVGELKSALQRLDKPGEVYVYPGAGHAFMHEGRPSYHADAAKQGWARMLAFLRKHLNG